MLNFLLTSLIVILILGAIVFFITRKKNITPVDENHRYEMDQIILYIKKAFKELINADLYAGNPSAEEFERKKNRRKELRKALRSCMHGDPSSKKYVKSYIKDLLISAYGFNESNINNVIQFDRHDRLSDQDRFDILLHVFKKDFKANAFEAMMKKYDLDRLKHGKDDERLYQVTAIEIQQVYEAENPKLSFDDKLDIIVQRVYQHYKGLGIIDDLRDQNIDGVSGGTSGVPEHVIKSIEVDDEDYINQIKQIPRAYDAVWCFFKGKSIQLQFLGFGSEQELRRICQNIYTFGKPGQLNESRGYIVNDMADGSRILVVRPPFAESWTFFVRKHNDKLVELHDQVKGINAGLAINMLIYLVKGKQNTLFTGQQGSGKTTLMKGVAKYIYTKNIRVQEMFAELWYRKLFPNKNILSFQETTAISAQDGMDIQKKTDGAVNIVGEIASHAVASLAIQAGQVASEFTMGSHHGNTFVKLVNALRNSLIANGDFSDERAAEQQVVSWLNFDVHLAITGDGERYIERITECIPIHEQSEYPPESNFNAVFSEYAKRVTDRKTYHYQDIIVWQDGEYIAHQKITDAKVEEMTRNMFHDDAEKFIEFLSHWSDAA